MIFGEGRIHDAAFSPDGRTIVTGSSIGLQTWDADTLTKQEFLRVPYGVQMVKWSPNGEYLFLVCRNGQDHWMLKMPEMKILYSISELLQVPEICYQRNIEFTSTLIHPNFVNFSDNSSHFVYVTSDNRMVLTSTETGEVIRQWKYGEKEVTYAFFEKEGQALVNNHEQVNVETGERIGEGLGSHVVYMSPDRKFYFRQSHDTSLYKNMYGNILYFGSATSGIHLRETGQWLMSFGISQGTELDREGCWSELPHRFLFGAEGDPNRWYVFVPYYFDSIVYKNQLEPARNLMEERHGVTSYVNPFSPKGTSFITNKKANSFGKIYHNFAYGLEVTSIVGEDTHRYFQEVHHPYANLFFYPEQKNQLLSMQMRIDDYRGNNDYNTIEIRDLQTSEATIKKTTETIGSVFNDPPRGKLSENGEIFASFTENNLDNYHRLFVHETETWERIATLPSTSPNTIKIIDQSKKIVVGGSKVQVWDIKSQSLLYSFDREDYEEHFLSYGGQIYTLDTTNDDETILFGNINGNLFLWQYKNGQLTNENNYDASIVHTEYLQSDKEAIVVLRNGKIILHNFITGKDKLKFVWDNKKINIRLNAISFTPDQKYLVIANSIWDWERGELVAQFALDMEPMMELDISPDGEWLAASFEDGVMRVWQFDQLINGDSDVQNFKIYGN